MKREVELASRFVVYATDWRLPRGLAGGPGRIRPDCRRCGAGSYNLCGFLGRRRASLWRIFASSKRLEKIATRLPAEGTYLNRRCADRFWACLVAASGIDWRCRHRKARERFIIGLM